MFIAEQQMVAAAVGMQVRGWVPFASTFAAFFSRAYDFVRMAAISRADIRLVRLARRRVDRRGRPVADGARGHRRVPRGPRLDRPAPVRRQPDGALVAALADQPGISFLRTLRGKTEVRTPPDEDVRIGGSRVVRDGDDVGIVACGITVDQAVAAAEQLAGEGIEARVIDAYSIKPLDAETVRAAARECGALVTVEDHWPEGGLGDAVLEALAEAEDRPPVPSSPCARCRPRARPTSCCTRRGSTPPAIADAARSLTRELAR